MSRQRFIDPKMWTSKQFIALSDGARLLFVGIITTADDYGVCKAHPGLLKAAIFPLDEDRHSVKDVRGYRDELAGQDLIRLWEEDGVEYLWIPSWTKYQNPQYKSKQVLPSPPEALTAAQPEDDGAPLCGPKRGHNKARTGAEQAPDKRRVRRRGSGSGSGSGQVREEEEAVVVVVEGAGPVPGHDTPEPDDEATASLSEDEGEPNGTAAATEPLKEKITGDDFKPYDPYHWIPKGEGARGAAFNEPSSGGAKGAAIMDALRKAGRLVDPGGAKVAGPASVGEILGGTA